MAELEADELRLRKEEEYDKRQNFSTEESHFVTYMCKKFKDHYSKSPLNPASPFLARYLFLATMSFIGVPLLILSIDSLLFFTTSVLHNIIIILNFFSFTAYLFSPPCITSFFMVSLITWPSGFITLLHHNVIIITFLCHLSTFEFISWLVLFLY